MIIYMRTYKISIVIPCIPRDIQFLHRLMLSIKKQTYSPYEIILSISGVDNELLQNLDRHLPTYHLPIIILPTYQPLYASENRNRGGDFATGNIISFMDADDTMDKERLYIINYMFNIYKPKMFIHGYNHMYKKNIHTDNTIYFGDTVYKNAIRIGKNKKINDIENILNVKCFYTNIATGHLSICRNIFSTLHFREGNQYKRDQDSIFIRDFLHRYPKKKKQNIVVFTKPLTNYYESTYNLHSSQ